jgi:DnaJ-class molecular chaperone
MDIFKMASDLANNMSSEDKDALQNMDMEQMISHVTKNVFKMMNNVPQARESSESESENEQDCIYPKTKDICFDLNVDLEDFYTGKKKKLNVKRKRIVEVDGKQTVVEEKKKLIIPIEKGMKDEQQIRFEGEADQIPGYKPGDIVITLIENEHPFFQRDGDNLIIIKNINLYQIYTLSFDIKHLDSRVLRIKNDDSDALHLNESLRKITGEGMPVYKGNGDYGDLFIRFNIVIPKSLDKNKLGMLKNVFNDPVQDSEVVYDSVNENCTLEHVSETDIEYLESDESETDDEESDDSSDDSLSESSEESESDQSESSEESEPRVKKSLKKKL